MTKCSITSIFLEAGLEKSIVIFFICFEAANSVRDTIAFSKDTGSERENSKLSMTSPVKLEIHWHIVLTNKLLLDFMVSVSVDRFTNSDSLNTRFVVSRQRFFHRLARILVWTDCLKGKRDMIVTRRQSGKFESRSDFLLETIMKMWWLEEKTRRSKREDGGYEWTNDINTFESYVFICFWKLSNFWFGDDDGALTLEIILSFVLPFSLTITFEFWTKINL